MNIHIIEHNNNFKKISNLEWESGWWGLDEKYAQKAVGGDIFFHKTRNEPSFFGGKVLSYRVEEEGDYQGKILFRLEYKHACRNVRTDKTGWSKEIKIIQD